MNLDSQAMRRDRKRCQACGNRVIPVLAVHHIVPLHLGGPDSLKNLTILCANCHRIVHWLSAEDRADEAHAFGCGETREVARKLLKLARRIRDRRRKEDGPNRVFRSAIPLETAVAAAARRNKLDEGEARLMERCIAKALRSMNPSDRSLCAVRMVDGGRFISILANNILAFRAPAWYDDGTRPEEDLILIWPKGVQPSVLSKRRFASLSRGSFHNLACINLPLTWEQCLDLSKEDWRAFRRACHEALTLIRTRRWPSNVRL